MAVFICQGCGAEHSSWGGKCPECGTAETIRLAPTTDRMVDKVVKGKFKIVRKLGQGGMGAVYLAEQLGIGHRVALKFLKSEFSSDPELARRFLNEAKSYARVAHPNAVALHDFGQDEEGNLFIAMEYCEGVDLKKVIAEQGRVPLAEAAEIVLQVAEVLANAHTNGVIHRDLKPENIMIRRGIRGVHSKVLDFGIARVRDAGTRLTVQGAIAGTPRYMSPEQVEGKDVDVRADVYSLGIVFFELLTGRQPFDGATISEILTKQARDPLPPIAQFFPEFDLPQIEAVLQRACAKRPEDRWPDMIGFASALSQALPTQAGLRLVGSSTSAEPAAGPPAPTLIRDAGTGLPASATLEGRGSTQAQAAIGAVPLRLEPALPTQVTQAVVAAAPRRSAAPVVAVIGACLAIGLGVAYAVTRPPAAGSGPVVEPPPVKPVPAVPTPDVNAEALKLLEEQARRAREDDARRSLGNGRTEFELARLDEAETYLKAVGPESESAAEAKALLEKIALIRERLKAAAAHRSRGQCDQALPHYKAVLELNARVKDAADGVAACRASMVDTRME